MKVLGIIPARYHASRFPGKPLVDINGKPMIQRVYEQCKKSTLLADVVVATDDNRILNACENFGAKVVMTSNEHQSGTDRCAEVVEKLDKNYEVVINIQGDEPFIDPQHIDAVAQCFEEKEVTIATLVKKIDNPATLFDHHVPKVVVDKNGFALYFSRATIPFIKSTEEKDWLQKHTFFKHIGIYGYHTGTLKTITKLPVSPLEKAEGLEQLRWLENGFKIKTAETFTESISIDVPEDLDKL
ncbi:MAG: 3-deoxy-manno-octulosonate cytidylyltransferase [Vicingaceae bacterium]